MFKHYLKTAIRNLKSNSAFNVISIVCMALGIGIMGGCFPGASLWYCLLPLL